MSKDDTSVYNKTIQEIKDEIEFINSRVKDFYNILLPSTNSNKTDKRKKSDPDTHRRVMTRAMNAINKVPTDIPVTETKMFDEKLYNLSNAKKILNPNLDKYVTLYSLAYNSYINMYSNKIYSTINGKNLRARSTGEKLEPTDLEISGRAIHYIYGFLKYVLDSGKDFSDKDFEEYVLDLAKQNGGGIPSALNLMNLGLEYNANRADLIVNTNNPDATLSYDHLNEIYEIYKTLNNKVRTDVSSTKSYTTNWVDEKLDARIDSLKSEYFNISKDDTLLDNVNQCIQAKTAFRYYYEDVVNLIKYPNEIATSHDYSITITPLHNDYEVATCKDQVVELAVPIKYNNESIVALSFKIYGRGQQDRDVSNLSFNSPDKLKLSIPGLQNIDVDLGLNRSANYTHAFTIYAKQYTISGVVDLLESLNIGKISFGENETVDATKDGLKKALIEFMKSKARDYQYYTNMELPTVVIHVTKVKADEENSNYNLLIDEATADLDFPVVCKRQLGW